MVTIERTKFLTTFDPALTPEQILDLGSFDEKSYIYSEASNNVQFLDSLFEGSTNVDAGSAARLLNSRITFENVTF